MSEILTPLVYQLGAGGVAGFVVGYAVKKIAKIVAVILGLAFLGLMYLGYSDIVDVNYDKLAGAIEGAMGTAGQAQSLLTPVIAHLPFAGTFAVGLGLGLKMG